MTLKRVGSLKNKKHKHCLQCGRVLVRSGTSVHSLAGVPAAIFVTVCSLSYSLAIATARLPSLLLMRRVGLEPTTARL